MGEISKLGNRSAFPITETIETESMELGIDFRDYFATAALQGMLSHSTRYKPIKENTNWHDAIAEEAYEIADSMLKQREL